LIIGRELGRYLNIIEENYIQIIRFNTDQLEILPKR